jgi:predicted metallo-beta-lactamase superfamily hydrolase
MLCQGNRGAVKRQAELFENNGCKIGCWSGSEIMLRYIKVVFLAEESFGVRSMCTYVETPCIKVLLDAGASLGPNRFGFPPHPIEYKALEECRKSVAEAADKAEVVTISHYHFDHHTPSYVDWCFNWSSEETARQIYEGKLILAKNYKDKVNFNQRRRGWVFTKTGGRLAKKLEYADGKTFRFGQTTLRFSDPVFHGPEDSQLGWLLMTTIEHENERFLFASDVQGPMHTPTLLEILMQEPQLVVVGGPPAYLEGLVKKEHLQTGMQNLESLVESIPTTIVEHHLLREEKWREISKSVFTSAHKKGNSVVTAAEFMKRENNLLELRRKQLFETEPPSLEFEKWMKMPLEKRRLVKPPI